MACGNMASDVLVRSQCCLIDLHVSRKHHRSVCTAENSLWMALYNPLPHNNGQTGRCNSNPRSCNRAPSTPFICLHHPSGEHWCCPTSLQSSKLRCMPLVTHRLSSIVLNSINSTHISHLRGKTTTL